jgi:hypothetical protein
MICFLVLTKVEQKMFNRAFEIQNNIYPAIDGRSSALVSPLWGLQKRQMTGKTPFFLYEWALYASVPFWENRRLSDFLLLLQSHQD